jgi:histidinol-phosphatase
VGRFGDHAVEVTTTPHSDPVLAAAVEAARAAGEVALKYYRTGFAVTLKPDLTPVTQADREAEQVIRDILARARPDCGFLGEELGAGGPTERRWIVDPIDGTQNFVRHIPFWATLIALEEAGEVTVGVIHNPVTGDLYTARRHGGAQLNGAPLRVSPRADLGEAQLVHAGLDLLRRSGWWEGFVRVVDATARQRGFGDYYGYTLVAEGKAEIYLEADLKPWDLAACRLLVEEAGGRFTDFDGQPTIYTGTALVTNGHLHDAVLGLLHRGGPRT